MEIMYVISETGYIMIEIYKWLQPECPPATWLTFTLVCIVYGEKCNNGKCNLDHWSASIEAQRKQHFLNDENMVLQNKQHLLEAATVDVRLHGIGSQ